VPTNISEDYVSDISINGKTNKIYALRKISKAWKKFNFALVEMRVANKKPRILL
jgi:hypothetical protein